VYYLNQEGQSMEVKTVDKVPKKYFRNPLNERNFTP
jgi:hypothetical protein